MKRCICVLLSMVLLCCLMPRVTAESQLDTWATGSFGSSQSFPVYSGPGEYYYRANSGKALYGGGSTRIYGTVNGWYMIGYGLTNGDYRIGYISANSWDLRNLKGTVKALAFDTAVAYADSYCRLTDDPIINNKMIYTIPRDTAVTVLSTMGTSWAYIEVNTTYGLMRGFVWLTHLLDENGRPFATPTPAPYYPPVTAYPWIVTPTPTGSPSQTNVYYHDTTKGDWLPNYQEIRLSGSWPVYSGPGVYFYRANNNKALMGGGLCRIYGVENGWVLIGYGMSNGGYRIGFISTQALPNMGLYIPYLDLQYTTRRLIAYAELTDDPVRYRQAVTTLPAYSYVSFLGYTYEAGQTWAYVEVLVNNTIMRGFIPATAME